MMENVENIPKEDKQKQDRGQFRYNTPYGYGILDNFGAHLVGKLLTFELMNNRTVTGKLKGYGQFDVIVTDTRTGPHNNEARHNNGTGGSDCQAEFGDWEENMNRDLTEEEIEAIKEDIDRHLPILEITKK